jgi:S1-C subfamily serine protease
MSAFDLIAIAVISLAALSGFRRGLVTGVFSLGGLFIGFVLGARVVPMFVSGDLRPWLPLVGLTGAMIFGAIGQTVGAKFGRSLRQALIVLGPLRLFDNVAGGFLGAAIGVALCWALGAVLLYLPGHSELRTYARDSSILSTLNNELPPAHLIDALARIDPFAVLAGPAPGVAKPDPAVLDSAGINRAALSVVRVIGDACGLGIEGSGWVAGKGLVVTNAHVVAGVAEPRIDRNDGRLLPATVVFFDKTNDLAVLRVPDLTAKPLPITDAVKGTPAGMLGYPGNGPYRETPVRVGDDVTIIGRDAYGSFPTSRKVTTLRGTIHSGNSGGPVVDAEGRVITTVFARRAASDGGYGVPTDVVRGALASVGTTPIETHCVDR